MNSSSSVVVFTMRGCSAPWLGAYGNEWIATPNLDRLAAEGIVFDQHLSDCPDPAAACRAWLTGQSATGRAVHPETMLKTLKSSQLRTVLVRANHPDTDSPEWFYADWSEVFDVRPQEEDRYPLDSLVKALPTLLDRLATLPQFLLWIDIDSLLPPWQVRQDVFEAYVVDAEEEQVWESSNEKAKEEAAELEVPEDVRHPIPGDEEQSQEELDEQHVPLAEDAEPVTPWSDPPTGPFDRTDSLAREWLQSTLAAVVTGLDAVFGVIFEQLRERGLDRSAAWLLTSDFGYPLGEHGQIGRYRPWLYEELIHLPLILRLPNAKECCRRVSSFTQPQDLCPTLGELLGANFSPGAGDATSILPLALGQAENERQFAITKLALGDAEEAAIRTGEWAYLLPVRVPAGEVREPQLFTKPDDRWEVNDLRARNTGYADELDEQLKKHLGTEPHTSE